MKLRSWLRDRRRPPPVPVLIVLLVSVGGYILASRVVAHDRVAEAMRRAQIGSVDLQSELADARAYVANLGNLLGDERTRSEPRFASLAASASGSLGLTDTLWVQSVSPAERQSYERHFPGSIVRLVGTHGPGQITARFIPAPVAAKYLPATFTTETRQELRPGVDVSAWPGLAAAIENQANLFAVSASRAGTLGRDSGFYLVEAANYGVGAGRSGFLAAFVPSAWLISPLQDDPRLIAIYLAGQRLGGGLNTAASGHTRFGLVGQQWALAIGKAPPTAWQTAVPWIALAWPLVAALLVWVVARGMVARRRAEAESERMFRVSRDLLCVAGVDGQMKRVNPAFERTLGYSSEGLRAARLDDLVCPDDLGLVREASRRLRAGQEIVEAEVRVLRADGQARWLEVNARPIPGEQVVYAAARDVTDRRRAEHEAEALAEEQAALRRVATLVAADAPTSEVLEAVVSEARQLLGASSTRLYRYEEETTAIVLANDSEPGLGMEVGTTVPLDGDNVPGLVLQTGKAARLDNHDTAVGSLAARVRGMGLGSGAGAPIFVEGRLWGVLVAAWEKQALPAEGSAVPAETESRLYAFTDLVAAAISNTESRDHVRRLADEQTALRRLATYVAQGATAPQLLAAVADRVVEVLDVPAVTLFRYEVDRTITVVATTVPESGFTTGSKWPLDGPTIAAEGLESGSATRIDDYANLPGTIASAIHRSPYRSVFGVPITVDGRLWGVMTVASGDEPLPADTEVRVRDFTELVAIAIANSEARDSLRRLASEQAALQRVARLVAEGPESARVFDAACTELGQLLDASSVTLTQHTSDGFAIVAGGWSTHGQRPPVGTRVRLTPDTIAAEIKRTVAPARVDGDGVVSSKLSAPVREGSIRSSVGAPVVVDGQSWGALIAGTDSEEPMPVGAELLAARFAELLATALSNAATRAELIASRARIVAAGDEARRRIERNLHDGTQQRLLALGLDLQRIRATIPEDQRHTHSGLAQAERDLESVLEDVRELSRGLHPALLSRGGLRPALGALARRSPIPVELTVDLAERPLAAIETAVYYVASEAVTNAIKHSRASKISVNISATNGGTAEPNGNGSPASARLRALIIDDGIGGAQPSQGSGLTGAVDRVDALGGRFSLESPPGGGTTISIEIPLVDDAELPSRRSGPPTTR